MFRELAGHFPPGAPQFDEKVDGVVVGLPSLECTHQDCAHKGKCDADRQHIQPHGKINGHMSPLFQYGHSLAEWGPNPKKETCCGAGDLPARVGK